MIRLLVLLLFISSSVIAQNRFGITGGVQLTGLHSTDNFGGYGDPRIGFRAGGIYEHDFTNVLGIRTELNYSLAGGKNDENRISISYISLPVLMYYKLTEQIRVSAGPELNIFLGYTRTASRWMPPTFKPLDFGISIGAEYRITEAVGISVRNYFGLIHTSELDTGEWEFMQEGDVLIDDQGEVIRYNRHNILQLSVSYYFGNPTAR